MAHHQNFSMTCVMSWHVFDEQAQSTLLFNIKLFCMLLFQKNTCFFSSFFHTKIRNKKLINFYSISDPINKFYKCKNLKLVNNYTVWMAYVFLPFKSWLNLSLKQNQIEYQVFWTWAINAFLVTMSIII